MSVEIAVGTRLNCGDDLLEVVSVCGDSALVKTNGTTRTWPTWVLEALARNQRSVAYTDTCVEHGPGGPMRLSFQIRVF